MNKYNEKIVGKLLGILIVFVIILAGCSKVSAPNEVPTNNDVEEEIATLAITEDDIDALIVKVEGLNLQDPHLKATLLDTLNRAKEKLAERNTAGAILMLKYFAWQVRKHKGDAIPETEANELIEDVQVLIAKVSSTVTEEKIDELIGDVEELNLRRGVERLLVYTLHKAQREIRKGRIVLAVYELQKFIRYVEAFSGRWIPEAKANELIEKALRIIEGDNEPPTIVYVDKDANGNNDGTSWEDAFNDLQDGLAAWDPAIHTDGIWVANGVYYPGATRIASFHLKPDMKLYGGFAGGETNLSERVLAANVTVLSGDIDHASNPDNKDSNGVTPTADDINGSNSYHVVFADGTTGTPITDSTVLDGFTITGGLADSSDAQTTHGLGGGMYCNGRLFGNECSPKLTNINFSGNEAFYNGGAMYNGGSFDGSSSPNLTNVNLCIKRYEESMIIQ